MRENESRGTNTAVAETPSAANDIVTVAANISTLLDQIQDLIAGFEAPTPDRVRKVAANAKFGPALIPAMSTAAENYTPLSAKDFFDIETARHALAVRDVLAPLVTRMTAIASTVAFEGDRTVSDAVLGVLQAYEWSKRHIRDGEGAVLRPYVDQASVAVKKTINRRSKTPSSPPAGQTLLAGRDDDDLVAAIREEMEA